MNKTLRTFLRSVGDTGGASEPMVMILPQRTQANVGATLGEDSGDAHSRRINGDRVEGR
jgi:hypothetical protein